MEINGQGNKTFANTLKDKVIRGHRISVEEALLLYNEPLEDLLSEADNIRMHFCGNHFDLCTIINARSGSCSENCKFCSQSSHFETSSDSYPLMSKEDILKDAKHNESQGVKRYSLVTSGRKLSASDLDEVCKIYRKLSENSGLYLCSSHGLLEYEDLVDLKNAGVKRYHNNLETSRRFFPQICTTHTYDDKINTIKDAVRVGLEVCSGGIIGLGEDIKDRIDMALDLRNLNIKSVPVNILNPVKGTPFEDNLPLSEEEILRTIAIFRFILPDSSIRLAGGRSLLKDRGNRSFCSGANAAITGDMLTTAGLGTASDIELVKSLGYEILQMQKLSPEKENTCPLG